MKRFLLATALLLPSCGSAAPAIPDGPPFDAIAFFTGTSHGEATLRQVLKGDRTVAVDSVGTPQPDGSLILDQHIVTQGEKPRDRRWVLRPTSPGHVSGTLTDAVGPVSGDQVGGAYRIRYTMKGGLKVEQWLVPIAGRNAVDNRLTVTKWGVRVAFLHETIVKQ